jgi:Ca2+-binding RTX toxin-like protein
MPRFLTVAGAFTVLALFPAAGYAVTARVDANRLEVDGTIRRDAITVRANTTGDLVVDAGDDRVAAQAGCQQVGNDAACDRSGLTQIRVQAGANDDVVDISVRAIGAVLLGGLGADRLQGGLAADELDGGPGGDTLLGGGGQDVARYTAAATATIGGPAAGNAGAAAGDTIDPSVEGLVGSPAADTLTGDGGANVLEGGDGFDTLDGAGGDDDLLPGLGFDTLAGGPGTDTASFRDQPGPIDAQIGASQHDAIANDVENLEGSPGNDILAGDAGPNLLRGGAGRDILRASFQFEADAADTLRGGPGFDFAS